MCESHLEALAVDNGWAALIILLLGDPHLLEGGEGSQDGSSDPDGVLPLWWSNDLDLDGGWCKGGDFLLHTVSNTRVHCGASRHDSVGNPFESWAGLKLFVDLFGLTTFMQHLLGKV